MLQIVVFSILFGIALALVPRDQAPAGTGVREGLAETMFKFTNIVMYFAPIGVGRGDRLHRRPMGLGILVNLVQAARSRCTSR